MANKTKRLSINALENATKDNYPTTTTVEWNGLQVVIRRNLGFDEMRVFVDGVTKACFADDDIVFMPENKDFAIRAIGVELYTNIATPSNLNKRYELLYASDIWAVVLAHIDIEQFSEMMCAIDAKIENIANASISTINKQAADLYSAIENIQEQLSSLFGGVGADDIKNLVGAISDGGIDEEKLMRAYIGTARNQE